MPEGRPTIPERLVPGDRVRFVSPASPVERATLDPTVELLEGLGLVVEFGPHAFDVHDTLDYLAGTDEARLGDVNEALRDPGVRAIIATRGGKGAYRIAAGLDVAAARAHPKLVVGFSEITIVHLALIKGCDLAGIHGAAWDEGRFGAASAASFVSAVTTTEPVTVTSTTDEHTHVLTTAGTATGRLIGGNQDSIATAAGWGLPSLDGAILLLEAVNLRLGHIDRQLTMLRNTGALDAVAGIAIGPVHGLRECHGPDHGCALHGGGRPARPAGGPERTRAGRVADRARHEPSRGAHRHHGDPGRRQRRAHRRRGVR